MSISHFLRVRVECTRRFCQISGKFKMNSEMLNAFYGSDPEQQETDYTEKDVEEVPENPNEHIQQQDDEDNGGSGTVMCKSVTEALIRKLGITGGGLDQLDRTLNAQDKDRFWAELFVELQSYGPVGAKDSKALKTKGGNLCTRFKAARKVNNKSGSGGNKFLYYDLMMAEVGTRPRFTCKALVDTSSTTVLEKVQLQNRVKTQKQKKR